MLCEIYFEKTDDQNGIFSDCQASSIKFKDVSPVLI